MQLALGMGKCVDDSLKFEKWDLIRSPDPI